MSLTNYSIEDLQILLSCVTSYRYYSHYDTEVMACLMFENDIEQAIKDKEFERDQTTLPPL